LDLPASDRRVQQVFRRRRKLIREVGLPSRLNRHSDEAHPFADIDEDAFAAPVRFGIR
jgi:hypothetical protein